MLDYILGDLHSQVWFYFKINDTMKKLNNSTDKYYNSIRYDLQFRYEYYCLLNDCLPTTSEFNYLLDVVCKELQTQGYETEYNTDNDLLIITKP